MFFKIIIFIINIQFLIFNYKWEIKKKLKQQLMKYKNNIYNLKYIKSLKKVVYTVLLGKYDNVRSIIKENGYDYFLFTDQIFENHAYLNWTILNINDYIRYLNLKTIKAQRFFKTHPHLFFQNYDLSIYIDSTIEIKGKLDEFLLRILSPNLNIYVLEHPDRNTINNEFSAVLQYNKDTNKSVNSVKNKYNKEKFPDNNGLGECCLIIRKHNEISCKNFMDNWFEEIRLNSHRDQLSFNYILWKMGKFVVKYISKKYIEKYLIQNPNHLIDIIFKDNITS